MSSSDLSGLRQEYANQDLDVSSVDPCPFTQFGKWLHQAISADLLEPNAMVLATVDEQGMPATRTVLLKSFDRSGFVYFTNYESRKAAHIAANPKVSVLFQWLPLQRQVEINGRAEPTSMETSRQYFSQRPRESQLGAWASRQSEILASRQVLLDRLANLQAQFQGSDVPLPPFWGGYRIVPERFEFWQGGAARLHDRVIYRQPGEDGKWHIERWSP